MSELTERANAALHVAIRQVEDAEHAVEVMKARLGMLGLELDRARANADAKRHERDEAALNDVTQNAPRLTDVERKSALLGLGEA